MGEHEKRHRIKPRTLQRAKTLRKESTNPERLLWYRLRNKRLEGLKFRRQWAIEPYVVDFYCPLAKLVIELDGESHVGRGERDELRTRQLELKGLKVIRVMNDDVLQSLDDVLEYILNCARERIENPDSPPSP